MKVGRFVTGAFKPMPTEAYLTLGAASTPHQIYELRIETTPMTVEDEMLVIRELLNLNVAGMEVLGVEAKGNMVKMQITGSPFAWAPLIAILPAIIVPLVALIIGIIFAVRIPAWALAAPFVAGGGAILLYAFMKAK